MMKCNAFPIPMQGQKENVLFAKVKIQNFFFEKCNNDNKVGPFFGKIFVIIHLGNSSTFQVSAF